MTLRQVLLAIGRSLLPHRRRIFLAIFFILLHTTLGFSLILLTSRFRADHLPFVLILLFSLHHMLSVFDDWILTDISARWVMEIRRSSLLNFLCSRQKSEKNSLIDWNELQLEIQWIGESLFSLLRGTLRKILQLVVFSIALFWLSSTLFLFCCLLFFFIIILGTLLGRLMNKLQEQFIISQASVNNFELEAARGMPLIRAFHQGAYFSNIHQNFLEVATTKSITLTRIRMIYHPIQIVLFLSTLLVVYLVGQRQVEAGALSQGHFHAFIAGLSLLHAPLSALSQDISSFLSHKEMKYLSEILNFQANIPSNFKGSTPRQISVRDLTFQYQNGPTIFQNISFDLQQGEMLGISGDNGSGKTTLALAIAGILHAHDGKILFSPPESRNAPISLVDQQGTVFSLTLQENLFFPKERPVESPIFVSSIFERSIDNNDNIPLSPETLSSGQKKLLSLERAFQHNHPIFIIDEPENSLDPSAQIRLSKHLLKLREQGKIIILCSHSDLFLKLCNQTIHMNHSPDCGTSPHVSRETSKSTQKTSTIPS